MNYWLIHLQVLYGTIETMLEGAPTDAVRLRLEDALTNMNHAVYLTMQHELAKMSRVDQEIAMLERMWEKGEEP